MDPDVLFANILRDWERYPELDTDGRDGFWYDVQCLTKWLADGGAEPYAFDNYVNYWVWSELSRAFPEYRTSG